MRPFFGRQHLLDRLHRHLRDVGESGQGRMLAVWGRRQTGKSRLLTEFVEKSQRPYLYFTGVKDASAPEQLISFAEAVRESSHPLPDAELLFTGRPESWDDAVSRLAAACSAAPTIVVLDEFPWAWETDRSLDGVLQNVWDRRLEACPVLFVLVGSDVAMMERLTSDERPLYGRPKEMVVRPFDPGECVAALQPEMSAVEIFDAYLVTGGYPRLVTELARTGDVRRFVAEHMSDENSDLVVVGQRSLDAEFPVGADARRVLSAIGAHEVGHATFSSVVGRLGGDGRTGTATTRAISLLNEAKRVVSIDRPIASKDTTKLRRYRIDDHYLRFWFRFIEPQVSNIARGRADLAVEAFRRDFSTWRGKAIEPVVREALFRLARTTSRLTNVAEVGSWWNRTNTHEFDVVAAGRDGSVIAVGTVKWGDHKKINKEDRRALSEARNVIPHAGDARLLGVAPHGATTDADLDFAFTADDLLTAWSV